MSLAPAASMRASRFLPSWPLFMALAAFFRVIAEPRATLNDPDTYMHIAAGRWTIAHGALPIHDPFSYTMPGALWTVHEWLSEVVMALIYNATGWWGLVAMTGACFGISMGVLTRRLLRHGEPLSSVLFVFCAIVILLPHILARPHTIALPVMVLWTAALFDARDAGRRPSILIVLLMVLWANLHGGYMFGTALALYLAGEAVLNPGRDGRRREATGWGLFLLATVAASWLTPLGTAGFLQPFRIIAMPAIQASVVEWLSPNFQNIQPLELWILGAIFIGFSTGIRLPLTRLVLLLALFHLSLQHVRHADLLAIVGPLAIFAAFGPQIAARIRSDPPSILARIMDRGVAPAPRAATLMAIGVAAAVALLAGYRPLQREDSGTTPAAALAAARHLNLTGPVFNTEAFSGYLIFNGVPTYVDGRFEMFGNEFLQGYLSASRGIESALTEALDGHGVSWTLLDPGEGAVRALDRRPGWKRVYADSFAVIHVREAAATP